MSKASDKALGVPRVSEIWKLSASSSLDSGDRQTDKATGVNQMILNPMLCCYRFRLLQDILRCTDYTTLCHSFFVFCLPDFVFCPVFQYSCFLFPPLFSLSPHPQQVTGPSLTLDLQKVSSCLKRVFPSHCCKVAAREMLDSCSIFKLQYKTSWGDLLWFGTM